MLFLCHHKILHKYCFQFLWGPFFIKLPREIEDNAYAKFWVTSKEHYTLRAEALRSCDLSRKIEGPLLAGQQHYGMLWYFLDGRFPCSKVPSHPYNTSLHKWRFMSQARRTRHFAQSARRTRNDGFVKIREVEFDDAYVLFHFFGILL